MNYKAVSGYNITLDQALKQGGFYGPTGIWNSLLRIDGLILRGRVETLVIKKDLQQVYMQITNYNKKKYRLPGGSYEKDIPNYIQAANECNEEARIKVKKALNTGIHYIKRFKKNKLEDKWYENADIRKELRWVGTYTEVYVAEYDGPYTGVVDDEDKDDSMYKNGKFYDICDVYDILSDEHKKVIDDVFPVIKRREIDESVSVLYTDDYKSQVHYYPYYTPREMAKLGVHNEGKNHDSDIEDEAIEWYHEYTDTLRNPDSENWLKEVQYRHDSYFLHPCSENRQLLLNLGWNPAVAPTIENVLAVSKRTEERLKRETNTNTVFIDEGNIFTSKDIVKNLDDFENGKSNILLITGLSGSGKTTMAGEMADEYGAIKLSLDYFQNYHNIENDIHYADIKKDRKNNPMMRYIDKYVSQNKELKSKSHEFSDIDLVSFKSYFEPFFYWLLKELENDKDNTYVVEGIDIMLCIPYDKIKKYPLICVETSAIKSLVRHWIRDNWSTSDLINYGAEDIRSFKKWNDKYGRFKKSINEFSSSIRLDANKLTAAIDKICRPVILTEKNKKVASDLDVQLRCNVIVDKDTLLTRIDIINTLHYNTADTSVQLLIAELVENITKACDKLIKTIKYDGRYIVMELDHNYISENITDLHEQSSILEVVSGHYTFDKLTSKSDVAKFNECMMKVFGETWDVDDSYIKKTTKSISFNGNIIGYMSFSEYNENGKKYLGIGNFIIKPEYQRHGHGTKILQDLINIGKNKYDEIYCYVDETNKKAINFYKKTSKLGRKSDGKYYVSIWSKSINESSLLEMKRSELDDSEFGLPELRKYPMPDKDHVLSAIKFFNYVSPENEKELAKNIKRKMKQYGVSSDHVGEKNRLKKYLKEDTDILEGLVFDDFNRTKPTLVFDLGGVFVDYTESIKERLYKNPNVPDDLVEELDKYISDTFWRNKDILEYAPDNEYLKFMNDHAPEHLKRYVSVWLKEDTDKINIKLFSYTIPLLKRLKKAGYHLYYISNWTRYSRNVLKKRGFLNFLDEYFDGGIFSGDVGAMKPDRKIFNIFFNMYKDLQPNNCIFFDDKAENIQAAMNIGMYGILFSSLYTPEWIIDNLCSGNGTIEESTDDGENFIYESSNELPIVYFMKEISPQSLQRLYHMSGLRLKGNVGVKISTGERGGHNFLQPGLIKNLVQELNGTILECNTAYAGKRNISKDHWETIKLHGFDKIAKVDLMDEFGEIEIPVRNGYHLKKNVLGSHAERYDSILMLSHFKGHAMAGYGGALKNMSIGMASSRGKNLIHTHGKGGDMFKTNMDMFLESMVDADRSVMDYYGWNNILYMNVANNLSIDCDCDAHPADPDIEDIGVFISTDPVAVDQACIDAVYNHPNPKKRNLINRIQTRNGLHTLDCAEKKRLGSRKYKLVELS